MDWSEILNKRSQTFVFSNVIPDNSIIEEIINEIHDHVPVKQNEFYYSLEIFDNSNIMLRTNIYKTTWAGNRYNPQVLAPWLFVFKENHNLVNKNKGYHVERNYANLQIGMVAMFIAMSAINKGLDVGFCQCIYDQEMLKNLIGDEVVLLVGLGYKSTKDTYYCVIDKTEKPVPGKNIVKPDLGQYTKWM